ncbi:M50 family metallopeptidase [Texcoconibacillus texcoconensis]|uniref:Uncharacterized protein n=1 Tax=Texcoconibacillus texcoconensis TaxID=1095777 RepID=A0A840QMD9_9BACI|nr:M50 family metallopeptidase [Texcoconibacillus texcoconensis]MBB5172513.1 hypothetical protein [Texcoconibacillus texcoconensis]
MLRGEGVAETAHSFWLGQVLTSFAGYPFASVVSVSGVWAVVNDYVLYAAAVLGVLLLINGLLWVRNLVGWLWVVISFVGLAWLKAQGYDEWFSLLIQAVVIIVWIQAFTGSLIIFVLSVKSGDRAGDATILARSTFIPSFIWGFVFALQGLFFFVVGLYLWSGGALDDIFSYFA